MVTFINIFAFKRENYPITLKRLSRLSGLSLVTVATLLGMSSQVQAASVTLNATTFGNYTSTTRNTATYVTGKPATTGTTDTNRSFFIFTIPAQFAAAYRTIISSQVLLTNPAGGYVGPAGSSRTLNVTNVTFTNLAGLTNGIIAASTAFTDLGTAGGTYGSTTVSSASNNTTVTINLGTNANADIQTRAGTSFGVGGALTGISTTAAQTIFNGSTSAGTKQLVITFADAQASTNGDQQFGNVLVGNNATRNLTVTNTGESGSLLSGSIGASSNPLITPTSGTQTFTNLGNSQSSTRTFTFAPTQRGTAQTTIGITSNTLNAIANPTFTGIGVAPQNSVTGGITDAGFVRIGTNSTLNVNVTNVGDGNLSGLGATSNLNGTVALTGSGADFSAVGGALDPLSLTDNVDKILNFVYAPTSNGPSTQQVTLSFANGSSDGRNQAQTQTVNLSGYGVGPQFEGSIPVGSTLDFGVVNRGDSVILPLTITNNTTDPTSDQALTGLTLENFFIDGLHADDFSLLGFTPGMVLAAGESITLGVQFTGLLPEDFKQATLNFLTDQGVAFGQLGQQFSFNLQGTSVFIPEPNSVFFLNTTEHKFLWFSCIN